MGRYHEHDSVFSSAGAEYGVDANLLKAIAWKLSDFDAHADRGSRGRGLCLVAGSTARAWAATHRIETFMPSDLYDPQTNVRIAAWALAKSLERWKSTDSPERFALADFMLISGGGMDPATQTSPEWFAKLDSTRREWVELVIERSSFYKRHGW